MPKPTSDLSRMVVDLHERTGALEQKGAVDHERISVLEKYASNMSTLPATVSALGQELKSLDISMKREVDGLREQQKAHKNEAAANMEKGFEEMGKKVDGVISTVNNTMLREATQRGWWQTLQVLGSIVVAVAVIAEAVKAFIK
jgi:hypothetical protein